MIHNTSIKNMLLNDSTRKETLRVSNILNEFFDKATGENKDTEYLKVELKKTIEELESLNVLALFEGFSPVYTEEGSQGKDLMNYYLEELRNDQYGKKL